MHSTYSFIEHEEVNVDTEHEEVNVDTCAP